LNLLPAGRTVKAVDGPVRQRSLWRHNLALALRQVADAPRPTSRAEIAAGTGLARATASSLVDDLVRAGLVAEVDPAPRTGAGRPATGLVLATTGPAGLGLEINVDYLAACVVDLSGAVRHRVQQQVDQRGRPAGAVLDDVARLAADTVATARGDGLTVAGATLAVPGLVHTTGRGPDGGLVRLAPNLGWRDLDVIGPLRATPAWPGLPLTVDNEANLAALGELAAGARPASFLYISGEIGIGAGIVLDGALFRGTHGWSGEIGHVTVAPDGPACRCGARGCLERYAGQEAILTAAGVPVSPTLAGDVAVSRVVSLLEREAPDAVEAVSAAGRALGIAAAIVVNLLDIDTVVLGGSYAALEPWLRGPVRRELGRRVLTARWSPLAVRASALGTDATVVGAAGSIVRDILADPAAVVARS
jgi:predicted NBD/HSP70 family sugar kinase